MYKIQDMFFDYSYFTNYTEKSASLILMIDNAKALFNTQSKQFFTTSNQAVLHLFECSPYFHKNEIRMYVNSIVKYYGRHRVVNRFLKEESIDIYRDDLMPFDEINLSNGLELVKIYVQNM